jgi:hypothetical protein
MTEKMGQIEAKVKGTVDDIKGSVEDTVDTVKQAFDIKQQVAERPWTMLGASVVAGYVLGNLGGSDQPSYSYRDNDSFRYYPANTSYNTSDYKQQDGDSKRQESGSSYRAMSASRRSEPGFMDSIMSQFGDELETLKDAALVTVGNVLRDMLKTNLPQFAEEFERARAERTERSTTGTSQHSTNQAYDPLERSVGDPKDTAYQTHGQNTSQYSTSPSATVSSSDPISNADRNTTY